MTQYDRKAQDRHGGVPRSDALKKDNSLIYRLRPGRKRQTLAGSFNSRSIKARRLGQ